MKYDLTAEFEISLAKETQRDITSKGNTERNHVPRKTRHTSLARETQRDITYKGNREISLAKETQSDITCKGNTERHLQRKH